MHTMNLIRARWIMFNSRKQDRKWRQEINMFKVVSVLGTEFHFTLGACNLVKSFTSLAQFQNIALTTSGCVAMQQTKIHQWILGSSKTDCLARCEKYSICFAIYIQISGRVVSSWKTPPNVLNQPFGKFHFIIIYLEVLTVFAVLHPCNQWTTTPATSTTCMPAI